MSIRLSIDATHPDAGTLDRAVAVVRAGEIVAFPTDTFYGLAVDPRDSRAVLHLFDIKGRVHDVAVPLIASDLEQVESQAGRIPALGRLLAQQFWPGPLSLVVEALPSLAREVHGGRGTVAVRVPAHAVARDLARHAGCPLTATSANRSGGTSPTTADEVIAALGDEVAAVLDGGPTSGGMPSTIVDVTGAYPILVRAGAVPWTRVLEFVQ